MKARLLGLAMVGQLVWSFGALAQDCQLRFGPEILVNTFTESSQHQPAITADAAGNFVVVWRSDGQINFSSIFIQRFNAHRCSLSS